VPATAAAMATAAAAASTCGLSQNVALALPPQLLPSHDVIRDASLLKA